MAYKLLLEEYIRNNRLENLNLDNVIDHLIQLRLINVEAYLTIWQIQEKCVRLSTLLNHILLQGNDSCEKFIKLLNNFQTDLSENQHIKYLATIVRGEFPKKPVYNIERTSLVSELRKKLIKLEPNQYLIVHGMIGNGKSSLVSQVLDEEMIGRFHNVYWINLKGHDQITYDLLKKLWRLYLNIVDNSKTQHLQHCPEDIDELKLHIKKEYINYHLNNTLLILDDVNSIDVLNVFDIGCKVLITTQEKDIIESSDAILVEVKTGFSKMESLNLLKNSIGELKYVESAETLHVLTKGHPMLIELIAQFLKMNIDMALNDRSIWDDVISMLGEENSDFENDFIKTISPRITWCLEKLSEELKEYYYDLAIFPPNVNIRPIVLENLWKMSKYEVRKILYHFAKKSLIVSYYHESIKTYIYGIHNLFTNYLNDIRKDEIKNLHKKLISRYVDLSKGNLVNLPNEEYILAYIGYHLEKAEDYDKFNIYFNLNFIEKKIRIVGLGDLLSDFEKYRKHITQGNSTFENKLDQIIDFVKIYGSDIKIYDKTSIIQYALNEKSGSYIYNMAYEIARHDTDHLYLKPCMSTKKTEYNHFLNINNSKITAIRSDFSSELLVLVGTDDGQIVLWYKYRQYKLFSHGSEIVDLQWSSDKKLFLSLSKGGTVKLWKFQIPGSVRNSVELSHLDAHSPLNKQRNYKDLHESDINNYDSVVLIKENKINAATFQKNSSPIILTGGDNGQLVLWDNKGKTLKEIQITNKAINNVLFALNNDYIIFSTEDNIYIYTYNENNYKIEFFVNLIIYNQTINKVLLGPKVNNLLAVTNNNVILWEIIISQNEDGTKQINLPKSCDIQLEDEIISSVLTNDHNYLILIKSNKTVSVYDTKRKTNIKNWSINSLPSSLDCSYDEKLKSPILFIALENTIHQYYIPTNQNNLTRYSSCYWDGELPLYTIITQKKLQILSKNNVITENNFPHNLTCSIFSFCGNYLFIGTDNGDIYLYEYRAKRNIKMISLKTSILSLKYFRTNTNHKFLLVIVTTNCVISLFFNDECINFKKELSMSLKDLFLSNNDYLVMVDTDCKIYKLNLLDNNLMESDKMSIEDNTIMLEAVDYCESKQLLAICYQTTLRVIDINFAELQDNEKYIYELSSNGKCLSFSFDGELLCVGQYDGSITVFNVNDNYKITTLSLHKSPVEKLVFAPSFEPILISLSDQLGFWNLKSLHHTDTDNVVEKFESLSLNHRLPSIDLNIWSNKQILEQKVPCLLSCMKLHGQTIKTVSTSADFKSFLIVDNDDKIYIMDIV